MIDENKFFNQVGGIPFSKFFRSTRRTRRKRRNRRTRRTRRKDRKLKTNRRKINTGRTIRKIKKRNIKSNKKNPEGLGYKSKDTPYNVVMRGVDDNLWENKKTGWIKLDIN